MCAVLGGELVGKVSRLPLCAGNKRKCPGGEGLRKEYRSGSWRVADDPLDFSSRGEPSWVTPLGLAELGFAGGSLHGVVAKVIMFSGCREPRDSDCRERRADLPPSLQRLNSQVFFILILINSPADALLLKALLGTAVVLTTIWVELVCDPKMFVLKAVKSRDHRFLRGLIGAALATRLALQ